MNIVIIDTGCANLSSVKWAVQRLGYTPQVSFDPDVVLAADKLLLPGVGTAQAAMDQLAERDLTRLIKQLNQPVLGICLGMQLLGEFSAETGGIETLGLVNAAVEPLACGDLPCPHMGWNQVTAQPDNPLFKDIPDGSYFYFVHSYSMPVNENTIAQCTYGQPFSAAIQKDNFYGVQFHPERSSRAGAKLIQNFLEM